MLESDALDLLEGQEVAQIYRHCKSCAKCRERRLNFEVRWYCVKRAFVRPQALNDLPVLWTSAHDTVTSPSMLRLVTGVAASVMLVGVVQMSNDIRRPLRPLRLLQSTFQPAQSPMAVALAPQPESNDDDGDFADVDRPATRPVHLRRVASQGSEVAFIVATEPRRPFVLMKAKTTRFKAGPVTIDPPPAALHGSLDFPEVPEEFPALAPPAHKTWRRFFAAVGAPFKKIARASAD